ncbi:MAG TPA: nuclear transport factor 2 family protein [Thermomicrobiales bacterium]|nr:nuclear transport factor 2 family protein [Thermomicrobiales bacterium]
MVIDQTTQRALEQFGHEWVDVELSGDAGQLANFLTDDFICVGPFGFVINKEQYLHGRRNGDLKHTAFDWSEVQLRLHDDVAIAVGKQTQTSAFQNRDASGTFRATQVLVQNGNGWKIASLHLCAIAPPPNMGGA